MAYYLVIGLKQMEDGIFISQELYAKEMLGTQWFLKLYQLSYIPPEPSGACMKESDASSILLLGVARPS